MGPIKLCTEDLILYPFTSCICFLPPKLISEDGEKVLSKTKRFCACLSLLPPVGKGRKNPNCQVTFHTLTINHVSPLLDFTG